MQRRDFLKAGIALGGAVALGAGCATQPRRPSPREVRHTILDGAPGDSGIDTVVVVMMENRSFDSYLGWLARDAKYMDTGRSRYGDQFRVKGRSFQTYPAPDGTLFDTYRRIEFPDADPWRACGHPDPGHGWNAGRAERDGGFLATGSGNDIFALSYFEGEDLPIYDALARRFVVCDRWHASVLGPTYPNREYLLSGQSGGNKTNAFPSGDGFPWDTIVDRLATAGVSAIDYYTDLPPLALWGSRMGPHLRTITDYYTDAAAGQLPSVSFLDPAFLGEARSDDHPLGDPRAAQRFVRDVFAAFARSPQWHNGLFIMTYDEWGGFFDHAVPPHLDDERASDIDTEDFSQAGFRVPTFLASPRSLPGAVDHDLYDHTSVLRFLEWRFLGAPARGPAASTLWYLTQRDRNANNPGALLSAEYFDPNLYFDLNLDIPLPSAGCGTALAAMATAAEPSPWEEGVASGYWEGAGV
ncbi:MAG TPA: alkaline phosphatase family protein [Acidimicrobiales bacterium]